MPRVAPVMAQDTMFNFVDMEGSDSQVLEKVEEGK